jgi:hypothetical protein
VIPCLLLAALLALPLQVLFAFSVAFQAFGLSHVVIGRIVR